MLDESNQSLHWRKTWNGSFDAFESGPGMVVTLTLHVALVLIVVCGNLLVILAIANLKYLQTTTNYFVLALAVADLLLGLSLPWLVVTYYVQRALSTGLLCLSSTCLTLTMLGASTLSLAAIAVDRYIAVCKPLHYMNVISKPKILAYTIIAWVFSGTMVWSSFLGTSADPKTTSTILLCMYAVLTDGWRLLYLVVLRVPVHIVVAFCYINIYYTARRQSKAISAVNQSVQHIRVQHAIHKDKKYMKILPMLIGCFILTSLPYQVLTVIELATGERFGEWLYVYLRLLSFSNSGINPWIYAYHSRGFRYGFRRLLICIFCCRRLGRVPRPSVRYLFTRKLSRMQSTSTGNLFISSQLSSITSHGSSHLSPNNTHVRLATSMPCLNKISA